MLVASLAEPGGEPQGALADVGAVTGATVPEHLARMRELMPRTPFLLPGIGAQGGTVDSLAPAFAPGRAAGLVTASRSIANAAEETGSDPAEAARAEAERLRETAWALV
jgi:orotidine-5'-phosphate decarboxylase